MAAELEVRVGLVVAEQDVVARRLRLDQVVLEQQRLGLGGDDGGLDATIRATMCAMRGLGRFFWK
jgi:hypothetical protein